MNRRDLLTGAAVGLAAGVAVGYAADGADNEATSDATPTASRAEFDWRMLTCWPEDFPGLGTGAKRLAQRITAMSGGRLNVRVFPAGTVVPALGTFDAISQGVAEMGHAAAHYWQGKSKAFNFFAAVPFGMTADEMSSWIDFGGGQEMWDEGYARFGLKSFLCGNTGVQMGGWFRHEMNSIEDFRGIKMRMPGLGGEVLRHLGATAENLPGGEVFQALSSGRIDATEWAGPWNDMALGFYRITKNYYWPGFHEPGSGIECMVNKDKYESLPDDLKAIVASACRAEYGQMLAEFNRRNAQSLKVLVEKHGVEVRRFPADVLDALGKASAVVMGELESGDDLTRRTYASFRTFRDGAIGWARLADQGFLDMRARELASLR